MRKRKSCPASSDRKLTMNFVACIAVVHNIQISDSRYDCRHLKCQSSVIKPQLLHVIVTQANMHTADRAAKRYVNKCSQRWMGWSQDKTYAIGFMFACYCDGYNRRANHRVSKYKTIQMNLQITFETKLMLLPITFSRTLFVLNHWISQFSLLLQNSGVTAERVTWPVHCLLLDNR